MTLVKYKILLPCNVSYLCLLLDPFPVVINTLQQNSLIALSFFFYIFGYSRDDYTCN